MWMLAGIIRCFRTAAGPPLLIARKRGGSLVRSPPGVLQPGPFSGRREADTSRPSAHRRVSRMTSTASLADHKMPQGPPVQAGPHARHCDTPRVGLLASEEGNEPALDP